MTAWFEWPALRFDRRPLPRTINYQRAVWGKVHGAPTDFRWIARSDDFGRDQPELDRKLSLGAEDVPANFQAWRNLGDRCYAINAYRSRAIDAAGRRDFLEKQILEWRVPAGIPPLVGALLLLPHVAAMNDSIWWDQSTAESWTPLDVHLRIHSDDLLPLSVDESALTDAIERGRRVLLDIAGLPVLQRLYGQLLAGTQPAFLTGVNEPLPPEAIAALLLPLPRDTADHMSIAGWIPSSRPSFNELALRWDVIIAPPEQPLPLIKSVPNAEAETLARQLAGEAPVSVRRAPAIQEAARVPRRTRPRPGLQLELTPPDSRAPKIVHELYDFARCVDRRWLTPDDVRQAWRLSRVTASDALIVLLCDWIHEVEQQRSAFAFADAEQWCVKVDLLRSAALVLAPSASILRIAPASGSRVPALFFGPVLERGQYDTLFGLGEEPLRGLLEQTLSCPIATHWHDMLRQWQQQWSEYSTRARSLASGALIAHPRPQPVL
jgi:hypothetical protein